MKEGELLRQLCDDLQSGTIVPQGVKAKVLSSCRAFQVAGRQIAIDAIVEFTVEHLASKPVAAVIEFKTRLTPMALEGAVHQVLQYRNELRRTGEFDELYAMVAAPYLSDSVQRRCKELGVGYVDLNGTFSLVQPGVYVDVVRPATAFKNPQGIKNIFAGRSRRIIRVLLANPHKPFRLEELASETQLSVGQVFQATKRLQEDGVLERTSQGRALTKPRRLLRLFSQEIKSDYLQNRRIFQGFSEMPLTELSCRLRDLCERKVAPCVFTLTSGLDPHERNLREDLVAAYIGAPAEEIRNDLGLDAVGKGANVLLMTPPESDNTEAGGVFYGPRKLTSGLMGVNPVQLYVDFTLHGSRGEEQAEFLIEHALGFRE
jgi:biotin operon repressor